MEIQHAPTHQRIWSHTVRTAWPIVRQVLGWLLIVLGLVGLVLPFLQGILFLVLGIALVGRRNWLIRRAALLIKRGLRRWAKHPAPWVGSTGRLALRAQHHFSRHSRHLHRRFAEHRLLHGDQQLAVGGRQSPARLPTAAHRLPTESSEDSSAKNASLMDSAVHHPTQADTQ